MIFLIVAAILGGLALWYVIGLLGSAAGLKAAHSNDWNFGRLMALGGPINLIAVTIVAVMERRQK